MSRLCLQLFRKESVCCSWAEILIDVLQRPTCFQGLSSWYFSFFEINEVVSFADKISDETSKVSACIKNASKRLFNYFKVGLSPPEKFCFICFIESPLNTIKNVFYFILKAPFVLKKFKVLSWLFVHVGSIRKIRLISKFMTS